MDEFLAPEPNIKDRYGDDAIMRASSLTEAGQARERAKMIGGHYK
jgi:DNA polymerase IV